jgi:MipA family protein
VPEGVIGARLALSCAAVALAGAAMAARADERPLWEAGVGLTVLSFPDYRGSNQRRPWVLPFPYLVYRGEFLKADERRVRGLLAKTEWLELDASFNATVPVKSSKNEAREGMPDLDPTVELGPSINAMIAQSADRKSQVELRLPVRGVIATDLRHAQFAGWVFEPALNLDLMDIFGSPGLRFGAAAGPMYSDRRHNEYFYSVDPAFATPDRPAYSPGGGYAGSQFILTLSKRFGDFWVGGFARWDTLHNAAFESSPLVKTEQYFAGGIAVAWMLGESTIKVDSPR